MIRRLAAHAAVLRSRQLQNARRQRDIGRDRGAALAAASRILAPGFGLEQLVERTQRMGGRRIQPALGQRQPQHQTAQRRHRHAERGQGGHVQRGHRTAQRGDAVAVLLDIGDAAW